MDTRTDKQKLVEAYHPRICAAAALVMAARTPGPGLDPHEMDLTIDGHAFHVIHRKVAGYSGFDAELVEEDPDPAA